MGNRYLNTYVETQKSHKQLKDDAAQIFRSLGGNIYETPDGFRIVNGTFGISMGFIASLSANIIIRPIKEGIYEIQVFLNWAWSSTMWVLFILGIALGGIGLLLLILYFLYDPAPAYHQMLSSVVSFEKL